MVLRDSTPHTPSDPPGRHLINIGEISGPGLQRLDQVGTAGKIEDAPHVGDIGDIPRPKRLVETAGMTGHAAHVGGIGDIQPLQRPVETPGNMEHPPRVGDVGDIDIPS